MNYSILAWEEANGWLATFNHRAERAQTKEEAVQKVKEYFNRRGFNYNFYEDTTL